MPNYKALLTIGCSLIVAACDAGTGTGGGGGVIVAPTPTPSPAPTPTSTPTPVPTPTPTPGPSGYLRFTDLTGSQSFRAACAGVVTRDTIQTPIPDGIHPFSDDIVMSFTSNPRTFTIKRFNNGYSQTFGPENKLALPGQATDYYEKVVSPSQRDRFHLYQPVISGVQLNYVREAVSTLQVSARQRCMLGVPTRSNDWPTGSVVDYTSFLINGSVWERFGNTVQTYSLAPSSTMQFRVDLMSGTVTPVLHLIGVDGGPQKDFGTFTGTGFIDRTSGGYSGTLTSPANPGATLQFAGAFFGPQLKEFGFAFNLGRMSGSPSDYDLIVLATASGTR